MTGRARTRIGKLLLAFASFALASAVGEIALRAQIEANDDPGSDDGWYERYRRMNETLYRRSADDELVYEPVPGAQVEMEYGLAQFNRAGMRDEREHALERSAATRIAMVGDSLVWSEFMALHDSLPRRVEEALGEHYEVLNFGVTGYDTSQEARYYVRAVRPFAPSIVIVVFCMNDAMIMSGPFERFASPADRARKDAQEARMERLAPVRRETLDHVLAQRERAAPLKLWARAHALWERRRFERQYVDEYLVTYRSPSARARVASAIQRLGAAIAEDGARPIFVIAPVLERWHDYRWTAIHDQVRAQAEAAGFEVLDPLPRWRADGHDPERLRVGGDNLHFGRTGNQVFGRTIAEAVVGD